MRRMMIACAALMTAMATYGLQILDYSPAERIVLTNRHVLVFRSSGSLTLPTAGTVDVLVVGGGGGGGANSSNYGGGGGGGGGVIHRRSFVVSAGTYSVSVGEGGVIGKNGGDSSVFGLTAYGGGGGAKYGGNVGNDGASGGGSTSSTSDEARNGGNAIEGQGCAGGGSSHRFGAGGGGGATQTGKANPAGVSRPGLGGDGYECDIVGTNMVCYGGGGAGYRSGQSAAGGNGGGGSSVSGLSTGTAGTDGLGGGGAGGAVGGSGVVIISYEPSGVLEDTTDFMLTGGDSVIPFENDTALVFTNSGILNVTGYGTVELLAVGGGGGGGKGHATSLGYGGAGGGGGGVVHIAELSVSAGSYAIEVGSGGAVSSNGCVTKALGVTAFGGGAGADYDSRSGQSSPAPYDGSPGKDGASGGGCCHAAYYPNGSDSPVDGGKALYALYCNYGNEGGSSAHQYGSGGGGGAGTKGGDGVSSRPGSGGDGLPFEITGQSVYYGGGGTGYRGDKDYSAEVFGGKGGGGGYGLPGTDGLGGGGSGNQPGGSGVVVVRFRKSVWKEEFDGATGGDMTRAKGYRIHTFAVDGTFTMPCTGKVEVLLVGGGGGGGYCNPDNKMQGGGGGGGGGVVLTNVFLPAGSYDIVVGAGGEAGTSGVFAGENGGASVAFGVSAYGGGGGARYYPYTAQSGLSGYYGYVGNSGASGGGSTYKVSSEAVELKTPGGSAAYAEKGNLGHTGGWSSHGYGPGGGGGAGEEGQGTTGTGNSSPGKGGDGVASVFSGSEVYYGGGGAGYRSTIAAAGGLGGGGACFKEGSSECIAQPGTDGLGGGGCGGAKGGSGVVIIRYKLPPKGTYIFFR